MTWLEDSLDLPLKEVLAIVQRRIAEKTTYFGIRTEKNPLDLWIYQEILNELRPNVIVEIGNYCGGSTLALAHICDNLNHGRIIGVDINQKPITSSLVRSHPRITLIEGDACASFQQILNSIDPDDNVLVIEDSSHTFENTLNVLRTYSPLIDVGSYFIVEDTNCHHGVNTGPTPGPYEAVEEFLRQNHSFVSDRSREPFVITWNPKGYLRRVKA